MKRAIRWRWFVFLAAILTAGLPPAWGATPAAPDTAAQTVNAGYLESVTFERLPGKERVTLAVSKTVRRDRREPARQFGAGPSGESLRS